MQVFIPLTLVWGRMKKFPDKYYADINFENCPWFQQTTSVCIQTKYCFNCKQWTGQVPSASLITL